MAFHEMTKPKTRPVAKRKSGKTTYHLYADGALWTTGKHAYLCGYVMDPKSLDTAIDIHEEELRCLVADFI